MKITKYNAKALFTRKFKSLWVIFCKIQIDQNQLCLIINWSSNNSLQVLKIPYDQSFVNEKEGFDPLYLKALLEGHLNLHEGRWVISICLPQEWIIFCPLLFPNLPSHHAQREAILYFQAQTSVGISEHHFFRAENNPLYFAVKKRILYNFETSFQSAKMNCSLNFIV